MVIKDVLSYGKTILEKADIESFLADSLILLCFVLKITKERYPGINISIAECGGKTSIEMVCDGLADIGSDFTYTSCGLQRGLCDQYENSAWR